MRSRCRTPTRCTRDYTTIYLVGHGQVFTIDSGEDFERYRWMLRGYLAAVEKAEIVLSGLSHHHADHSANLAGCRTSSAPRST